MSSEDVQVETMNPTVPSTIEQILTVFKLQMRVFSKNRSTYMLILLVLLIPILAFSGAAKTMVDVFFEVTPSTSYLLALLPLMTVLIPSMVAGRTLSSDFRNRVVYLNFPLPVTRTTYYAGKFIASLVLSLGLIIAAIGLATISGDALYSPSYPNDIAGALMIGITGTFAITATAYGLGPFFKRGSIGLNTILTIMLPFILLAVAVAFLEVSESTWSIIQTLPQFSSYQMLFMIDHGFGGMFGEIIRELMGGTESVGMYAIVSLIWGIAFLALGWSRVVKKEL